MELGALPAVAQGKTKLTNLLKSARFTLFPGAAEANGGNTNGNPNNNNMNNSISSLNSLNSSAMNAAINNNNSSASGASEGEITELFVKCTAQLMQEKIGTNK